MTNGGAEEDLRRGAAASRGSRVHDGGGVDTFREKPDPLIDLPQTSLAVLVVSVLAAIAVAGRPRHHGGHGRPLAREQELVLVLQPLQAGRGDVFFSSTVALIPSIISINDSHRNPSPQRNGETERTEDGQGGPVVVAAAS